MAWRAAFIAGLLLSAAVYAASGLAFPPISIDHSIGTLIIAGPFVGLGSRVRSGCTSGYRPCDLLVGQERSRVATGVFMGTEILTVFFA